MFPREQEAQDSPLQGPRRFSLPTLQNNPGHFIRNSDDMRRHYGSHTPTSSPDCQVFLQERHRGKSFEEGVHLHTKLPSVASLMPSSRQMQERRPQHEETFDSNIANQQQGFSDYLAERRRAQTLPQASSPTVATMLSMERNSVATSLSGLSGSADPRFFRSNVSPSDYSSRWSPYTSMSSSRYVTSDSIATLWDDVENIKAQKYHRRRRTSPRRRLAASKARAHAMQLAIEGEQEGQSESDRVGYPFVERSYEAQTPLFVAQISTSNELSVPMQMPPHHPPPLLVDEFATSPSKKSSRYLREMDRRIILARLERGEKQSVLAKEFRVTRAAICNLNKHRDLVLSRQHEDPFANHPKKSKWNQESTYYAKDTTMSLRDGSSRISFLLPDATQPIVHTVTMQPTEHYIEQ